VAWIGAVIYKEEDGIIHVLIQDSESLLERFKFQGVQTKFPGGSNDDMPGEVESDTLAREIKEETFLELKEEVSIPRPIFGPIPGERYPRKFYLIGFESFRGTLRDVDIVDGDDLLHPPRWVKLEDLLRNKDLLYETHQAIPYAVAHYFRSHPSLVG